LSNAVYHLAAIAAFVIWGFFSLVLKPMAVYPAMDILHFRVYAAAILMGAAVLMLHKFRRKNWQVFKGLSPREKRNTLLLTLAGGVLLTSNWYFFIYTMNIISIKSAAYAYMICPIITTVLGRMLLKEQLSNKQWLAVVLCVLSCVLLSLGHFYDALFSLFVAFSYALYLITQRINNRELERFFILAIQMLFSALLLLPVFPYWQSSPAYPISFYSDILIIAIVFTILPLWLNLFALRKVSSATMGMLLYVNPLLNFLVASLIFKEEVSPLQLSAYGLVALSVLIFNSK
jgi:chloramphenicol-sensitive protein RarD